MGIPNADKGSPQVKGATGAAKKKHPVKAVLAGTYTVCKINSNPNIDI